MTLGKYLMTLKKYLKPVRMFFCLSEEFHDLMTLRCPLGNIDLSMDIVNHYQEVLGDYPRVFDDY